MAKATLKRVGGGASCCCCCCCMLQEFGDNVPACASFVEVADPSMEATRQDEEPSLALPKAFVRRFQAYLGETVVVEAPGGEMWKAFLEADEQKQLRITDGWRDVAHHLNVQSGDLLVLDLVSKGHFQVHIYEGEDMCEKDLYTVRPARELSCNKGIMHNTNILPAKFKTNAKKQKGEVVDVCKAHATKTLTAMHGSMDIVPYHLSRRVNKSIKEPFTIKDLHELLKTFHEKTHNAFKMALSYSSNKPFTTIMMLYSHVCYGYKVGIPSSFAKQHLSADAEHVALIDTENKAWSVIWLGHNNPNLALSGGWKHFAVDHHLKCGDICIFEKTSMKALTTFKVHIFKVDTRDGPILQQRIPSKLSSLIAGGFT